MCGDPLYGVSFDDAGHQRFLLLLSLRHDSQWPFQNNDPLSSSFPLRHFTNNHTHLPSLSIHPAIMSQELTGVSFNHSSPLLALDRIALQLDRDDKGHTASFHGSGTHEHDSCTSEYRVEACSDPWNPSLGSLPIQKFHVKLSQSGEVVDPKDMRFTYSPEKGFVWSQKRWLPGKATRIESTDGAVFDYTDEMSRTRDYLLTERVILEPDAVRRHLQPKAPNPLSLPSNVSVFLLHH
jgi:hypothetical protein